ncbi:MAG: glycosyltransferase [Armatimonadota bacterium]|nr:glycosyltransferase [Armatimonadota bacterium]
MRILYVTPYVPSPIRVRPYNFIKSLAKRHSVTLVSIVQSDIDHMALPEMHEVCDRVKTINVSAYESLLNAGKGLLTRMPMQAAYTYVPRLMNTVDQELEDRSYDVLHVEHVRAAHYAAHIDSLPKIYDSVDCITLLLRQMLDSKRNPFSWLLTLEEWAKMRVYEGVISQQFSKVITTSETDREALEDLIWRRINKRLRTIEDGLKKKDNDATNVEEWRVTRWLIEMAQEHRLNSLMSGGSQVTVVPNGVDFERFQPMDGEPDPDTIVFSGKMSYYANACAVKQFYERVYPLVKAKKPKVKFRIVGYNPPANIRKLAADPSVTVTGYVDDIRPYIASSSVAVCPISVGVGIQNKVLEAMAMGKPVVCASIARRAIKATHGKELLCADSPEEIADAVINVLDRPELRKSLGENAVKFVRRNHNWDDMAVKLEEVYHQASDIFRRQRPAAA